MPRPAETTTILRSLSTAFVYRGDVVLEAKRVVTDMFTRMLLVDIGIGLGGTVSWALYLDVRDIGGTIGLCLVAFVVHVLLWSLPLWASLQPIQEWARGERAFDDQQLLAADRVLERLPMTFAVAYAFSYLCYFGGIAATAWWFFPDVLSFGEVELSSMGFQFAAVVTGAPMTLIGWTGQLLAETQAELARELATRKIEQSRLRSSMRPRLLSIGLGLVMSTSFWLLGTTWLSDGHAARKLAGAELREAVRWSASELAHGASEIDATHEIVTHDELPSHVVPESRLGDTALVLDVRIEQWTAVAAVGDGRRYVLASKPVTFDRGAFWIATIAALFSLAWFALISMLGAIGTITGPLERLQVALHRVVAVGDLRELGRIPVLRTDEIGEVVREFNHMLDVFEQLANAAQKVAAGDLRLDITGHGDLQDAFRNMVERLAELVVQIRDSAVEVASAAAEITAATRGQEQATGAQSDELRQVSLAMDRLARSAGDISTAATEVLTNARQTGERADQVGTKLADLGLHVARVSALLQLIRDIADRSDLLALNGSLEATRAGEAGRGFALVATEMRRLAERVTAAVTDVRATISDVEASNLATALATQESRELAESTTAAARRIVEVTDLQGAETERVSEGMREIADVVGSTAHGIAQTRATADALREQAQQLEHLIGRFEL
jgi:methyl-accepting chemotaxis protein